jgi:hypothetical protein
MPERSRRRERGIEVKRERGKEDLESDDVIGG